MTQNEPLDDSLPIAGPASQTIGANNPPSPIEMAREQWKAINDFLMEHPAILDEDAARKAKLFLDRGKAALADLEAARKAKADPLYAAWNAVNDLFRPAKTALDKIVGLVAERLTVFIKAEEARRSRAADEKRRIAEEAERWAREAEAREKEAIENAALGEIGVDVGAATEAADNAFDDFKRASRGAAVAERDSHVKIGGGFTRSAGLRTKKTLVLDDAFAALKDVGVTEKISDAILSAARDYKRLKGVLPAGVREIEERSL